MVERRRQLLPTWPPPPLPLSHIGTLERPTTPGRSPFRKVSGALRFLLVWLPPGRSDNRQCVIPCLVDLNFFLPPGLKQTMTSGAVIDLEWDRCFKWE